MPDIEGPKTESVVLKFGGGIHSRASEEDINERECADGENFELDLENYHFRRRKPFSTIGQTPNGEEIRGFASLLKSDGTTSMLVQAQDTVYEWDGSRFTSVGTVEATSQLRGRISHNYTLNDLVLITDLNLADVVMSWDGTTLSDVSFTDEDSASYSPFKAKYCNIVQERALFANVIDKTATSLPHMLVGTKVSDYTNLTVANQPSSALGEDDPFYLLTPDLRPINGLVSAFGITAVSSVEGQIFKLTGQSAQDYVINELYPESGASGDEAVTYIGNDIMYGRPGVLESLTRSDKYGDVETDDLSVGISDSIDGYTNWTIVYNKRTKRIYCYSDSTSEIWMLYKPLLESGISPWVKMTTLHSVNMDPTAIMNCYDPLTGLEEIYFGDASGNVYMIDGGDATTGDAGISSIRASRKSKLISMPRNADGFTIQGYVKYRKLEDVTLTLRFFFQGTKVFTKEITISLTSPTGYYFGGINYFGGSNYFGSIREKFSREIFGVAGESNEFQIEAIIDDKKEFAISEIGLDLEWTTQV